MNTHRLAVPACAALAIALAGCSGGAETADRPPQERDAGAPSMTRTAPVTATPTPNAEPAGPPSSPGALDDPTAMTGMDTGQAQALASCRALIDAKTGALTRPGPDAVADAARDLAADPNALAECQARM